MPVNRGDPLSISAGDWNDVVRLLEQWRANGRQLGGLGITQPLPFGWVWLKNTTATDRAFGDVLGIDDWLTDVAASAAVKYDAIRLKGNTPATATHCGNYAVLQEPIKAGGFGRAAVSGVVYAKLDITHASDKFCEIADTIATSLKTNPLGSSRIIAKSTGTGSSSKWGQIRLGEPSTEIVVDNNTGSAINGGSGTFRVLEGTPGSETATGQTITAWSFANFGAGKKGSAAMLQQGHFYASPQQP